MRQTQTPVQDNAAEPEGRIVDRRGFLASTTAGLATAAWTAVGTTARAQRPGYGKNAEPARYPDPDVIVLDKRFAKIKIGNTAIQRLHTGMLWAEGPAWNGVGKYLVLERHPQ